jgi:pimeloyl-ACP methyl ester carboxylesterase
VLLPGWAVSAFTYRHQLPLLAAAGRRAVSVDLKGHGFSDKPTRPGEYTFEAMLRHVEEVVGSVVDRPAVLIGQSMSGPLVIELAIRRPDLVSAQVLVSPVGLGVIPFIKLARALTPRFVDPIAPYLVPRLAVRLGLSLVYGDPARITEDTVEEYWAPAQFPGFSRALRALVHDFSWAPISAERLNMVAGPSLVVLGSLDRLVRHSPALASRLPQATILCVEGGGHGINEERAEEVNAAILELVNRQAL